jgi:hypothetical protein
MMICCLKTLLRMVSVAVTELEHICGLRVQRDLLLCVMYVDQTEYIENKAAVFGITGNGFVYNMPMESNFKLGERPEMVDPELVTEARLIVGLLIYSMLTRPDCKYACSKLASVVANPIPDDIGAMCKVLQYLYDTWHTCLKFMRSGWVGPDGVRTESVCSVCRHGLWP